METRFRKYRSEDFLPVRDFLVANYRAFEYPVNWDLVRWNYARYFCAPMLGAWGCDETAEVFPDTTRRKSMEAVRLWEESIGVWVDEKEEIAGLVCPDEYVPWHPAFGQAFLQRRPDYEHLLADMLAYAQQTFVGEGVTRIYVGTHDGALEAAATRRGFLRDEQPCLYCMEYDLSNVPEPDLPQGYRFQSMAEDNDLQKRRKVFGLSFKHMDPNEWPTVFSYEELQRAPDYRKDLDVVVVGPDGEYVACTVGWVDIYNKIATLEPVGALQLGMGREVVMEGLRRVAALGAEVARVDSDLKYYEVIGYKKKFPIYRWVKKA
ncbi:MAG: hypothetical protein GTN49_03915 [candidate division Zixibacteria bacterium]|nr:hypothetical protein [candidate division Zixibacteria bacterium]